MATICLYHYVDDIAREVMSEMSALAEFLNAAGEEDKLSADDLRELIEALSPEAVEMLRGIVAAADAEHG